MAAVALVAGILVGSMSESASVSAARDFGRAWERTDLDEMYELLTPAAQGRVSPGSFRSAYGRMTATTTARRVRVESVRRRGDGADLAVVVSTRAFGTIRGTVALPMVEGRIDWRPHMTFPGVRPGTVLSRQTSAPRRASILARDGAVIATGPAEARTQPAGAVAQSLSGALGPPEDKVQRDAMRARGFPPDTLVGLSGLERLAEERVAGTPGGLLFAGGRVLASTKPRRAKPVRTTIDLEVQEAAVNALAGRFGGVAALDARSGHVRALAGIAFSGPQPPGSTFKIVTAAAALEEGIVKPGTKFPVETKAVIDGVDLENANGESCGGSFVNSFAHSCNSVFAPLGVRIGARRLVREAERFGWNERQTLAGALPSTIPPASEITTPIAVGATAIGQGKVLATPLQMASVAQTIAGGGVRTLPTIFADDRGRRIRVVSRTTAERIERMMIDVVAYGTGQAASLAPTKVAGKTGTAELTTTVRKDGEAPPPEEGVEAKPPGYDTDAWFTAYAPIRRPELAVCVLFVHGGAGGTTAAPAAKLVLQAGIR